MAAKKKTDDNAEEKKPVGRPRKISSPEEFDRLADNYFNMCKEANEPVLLLGLVLALGFVSKDSLYSYGADFPEFTDSVKRARSMVEYEYEKRLQTATSATGPIFALKNFGWSDKQEIHVTENKDSLSLDEFYSGTGNP